MTSKKSEEKIQAPKPTPVLYMMEVSAPCRTVMFAAGLAGVQLEWKHIDWANGEHLKPDFLKPILTMRTVEQNDNESPWVKRAQFILSSIDPSESESVQIDNVLVPSENDFIDSRATREIAEGVLVVSTSAYFTFADMGAKLNSRDGLEREAEEAGLNITFGEFVQCADINSAALDFAYSLSSDIARQRFDDKGITMNIPDDLEAPTGPLFVESRLDFSFDPLALEATVQSTRIITDVDSFFLSGVHYCRLWSPLEALEFIYIYSLKNITINF